MILIFKQDCPRVVTLKRYSFFGQLCELLSESESDLLANYVSTYKEFGSGLNIAINVLAQEKGCTAQQGQ